MSLSMISPFAALAIALLAGSDAAMAQTQDAQPPVPPSSATGSTDVLIDGKPAPRAGDLPGDGAAAPQGSPDVLINGKPAMTGGGCPPGSVPITSPNVFINGKPAVTGCSK